MQPIPPSRQPDQTPERWDDHVSVYEAVFEPFSLGFARAAFDAVGVRAGAHILDVGAGCGGAALDLAARGCRVTAVDASGAMVARIGERAAALNLTVEAHMMDGEALAFAAGTFDAAVSIFGVVLFPDAVRGLAEMRRVVRAGGRVCVVTWTEPQDYELAATLRAAISAVTADASPTVLPAQLRFREREDFVALFRGAGFAAPDIAIRREVLVAPSARWLAERMRFAPGMAAQLDAAGVSSGQVLERFVSLVETAQGTGAVSFGGVAFIGTAVVSQGRAGV